MFNAAVAGSISRNGMLSPTSSSTSPSSLTATRSRAPSLAPSLSSLSAPRLSSSSPAPTPSKARLTAASPLASSTLARSPEGSAAKRLRRVASGASLQLGKRFSVVLTPSSHEEKEDEEVEAGASSISVASGSAVGGASQQQEQQERSKPVDVPSPSTNTTGESSVLKRTLSPPASPPTSESKARGAARRRRTWWGLGPEETPIKTDSTPAVTTYQPLPPPPPPMNAEEAAFREALMRDTNSSVAGDQLLNLPSVATQEQQQQQQARRTSWFGWRGSPSEDASLAVPASAPVTAAPSINEEAAQLTPAPAPVAISLTPSASHSNITTSPATTARRTWFARNATLDVVGANHAHSPLRQTWRAASQSSLASEAPESVEETKVQGALASAVARGADAESSAGFDQLQSRTSTQQQQQGQTNWAWGYWPLSSAPKPAETNTTAGVAGSAPPVVASQEEEDTKMRDASPPPSTAPSGVKAQAIAYSQEALGLVSKWSPVPLPASWGVTSSSSPTTPVAAVDDSNVKPTLSPAEQVKAAALARPSPPTSERQASKATLNGATKSGWIAYFSSKSAQVAASHIASPPDGPEEMDIDVESTTAAGAVPQTGARMQSGSRGTSKAVLKPAVASIPTSKEAEAKTVVGRTLESKGSRASLKPSSPILPSSASARSMPPASTQHGSTADGPKPDPAPSTDSPMPPMTRGGAGGTTDAASGAPSGSKLKSNKGPNLILPSFDDTFTRAPRAFAPKAGVLGRTLSAVSAWVSGAKDASATASAKTPRLRQSSSIVARGPGGLGKHSEAHEAENRLPRTWHVMGLSEKAKTKGVRQDEKIVVIGLHGWFSVGPLAKVFGEPTGTSTKLATMMADAVRRHYERAGLPAPSDAQLTLIPLQGDGKVADRVDRHYAMLLANAQWVTAVKSATVVLLSAHSQGCVVATHLLARLLEQGLVVPSQTRVALLAVAGINHGPFNSLLSGVSQYYLNAFESPAAKELFEFQSSSSNASQQYAAAQRIVLRAGAKVAYVASVDDQVVPLYSALNSCTSHPSILRALFCDGQQFARVDFLTNLLAFCVAVRNAGLPDHGLLSLLSASVAGSLYAGAGHSRVYEEPATYDLAVRYLYETTSPLRAPTTLTDGQVPLPILESFEPQRWNPYSLPWALRGLLEDVAVRELYSDDIVELLDAFARWTPATKTLKDVQWRLEPMRMIPRPQPKEPKEERDVNRSAASSVSKL